MWQSEGLSIITSQVFLKGLPSIQMFLVCYLQMNVWSKSNWCGNTSSDVSGKHRSSTRTKIITAHNSSCSCALIWMKMLFTIVQPAKIRSGVLFPSFGVQKENMSLQNSISGGDLLYFWIQNVTTFLPFLDILCKRLNESLVEAKYFGWPLSTKIVPEMTTSRENLKVSLLWKQSPHRRSFIILEPQK